MSPQSFVFRCMLLHFCARFSTAYPATKRPNIVVFLVDDMGWNDVGYHGQTEIPTPNIDALAYNGVILNNYYNCPLCSPSRSALMSGRLPTSTGLQHFVILGAQPVGLPLNLKTLPQFLNDLGYESRIVGKWHLGFHKKEYTPTYRGFSSHYGFWTGLNDHFSHIAVESWPRSYYEGIPCNDTREEIKFSGLNFRDNFENVHRPGEYLADLFTERSVEIINHHDRKKPLFLYLAHHGVHRGNFFLPIRGPENITKEFTNIKDGPARQNFAGAMTSIDRSLGEVMEALEKRSMLKDTIIMFATDNGAPRPLTLSENGGSNYPLRGGKESVWEGGMRGPAVLWDGRQRFKCPVYKGLMHVVDWLPTLYAAAGGHDDIVAEHSLGGFNMWPSILEDGPSPRQSILLQADSVSNQTAYRSGDFKLIIGQRLQYWDNNNTYSYLGRGPPPENPSLQRSKTVHVLRRTFGGLTKVHGTPIEVNCGTTDPEADPCDPAMEPCLFNVREDPCEQRNLAKRMPEVMHRIQMELSRISAVQPNNAKAQYGANPDFWGGVWTNWQDYPPVVSQTQCM